MKPHQPPRQVYCIGLGGVGVSAVARLFLAQGVQVSGSDPQPSPLIDDVVRAGGRWFKSPDPARLADGVDLVVATDDAPADHPERVAAVKLGIPCENFSVTLGRLTEQSAVRITVAGTNGKSTTTALTGLLAANAGLDPTVMVGSRVPEFSGNLRMGSADTAIIEADEFRDHFLNYRPTVALVTNIEPDHLDYFGTTERMTESFRRYLNLLPPSGVAVLNADDHATRALTDGRRNVVSFGWGSQADLRAIDHRAESGRQTWETLWQGKSLGQMTLNLPGRFNVTNALAAMAAALTIGARPDTFPATLENFHGIWRRFQVLTPNSDVTVISDYAHHPTAIRVTLEGARAFYPGRRIVAVFQPHHRSRLTSLFSEFVTSFADADDVFLVETYSVPGRDVPETESKTSADLAQELERNGRPASYLGRVEDTSTQLIPRLRSGDVVIIMGAGAIWRQAESLATHYGSTTT